MKRARKHAPAVPKPRNPFGRSPLLGKGHAHEESRKARRRRGKADVARDLAGIDDE